ncbi:MAG: RNHCP domain-containing protein [Deltaproteobacteria bacterium]|nr:RNHCP domain-containing protein [Deltaproteobacteria bacterium]
MRDEAFTCLHCGAEVPPMGHTARDHCPHCLRSLHVDVVPGDRANPCGGLMDPVGVELAGERVTIHYRCRACGEQHRNKALLDGAQPDTWRAIVALSKGEG